MDETLDGQLTRIGRRVFELEELSIEAGMKLRLAESEAFSERRKISEYTKELSQLLKSIRDIERQLRAQ